MKAPTKKRIDWLAVREMLKERAAVPAVAGLDTAAADRLLTERTRSLATRNAAAMRPLTRVLKVRTGAEHYAVSLASAREVLEIRQLARLPGVSAGILGILNWRGTFVPVFDLAVLVGGAPVTHPQRGIVLAGGGNPYAIAVDAVEDMVSIDFDALQPAQQLARKNAALFRGATAEGLIVLDEAALNERLRGELNAA